LFGGTTLEFKEIRKEWKARKKEEDNQRKADEERQRSTGGGSQGDGQSAEAAQAPTGQSYGPGVRPHLPPIGYAPTGSQAPAPYPAAVDQMYQQNNGQVYSGYPHSPYVQGQQMYASNPRAIPSPVPGRRVANIGQIVNAASVSPLCARVLFIIPCAWYPTMFSKASQVGEEERSRRWSAHAFPELMHRPRRQVVWRSLDGRAR
jgi:hypothetical protein